MPFALLPFAIGAAVGGGLGFFSGVKSSEILIAALLAGGAFALYKARK